MIARARSIRPINYADWLRFQRRDLEFLLEIALGAAVSRLSHRLDRRRGLNSSVEMRWNLAASHLVATVNVHKDLELGRRDSLPISSPYKVV